MSSSLILPAGLQAARPNRAARRFLAKQELKRLTADPFRHEHTPPQIAIPQGGQLQLNILRDDNHVILALTLGSQQIQIPLPPQQAEGYGLALIGLAGQVRLIQAAEPEPELTAAEQAEQDAKADALIAELMAERQPLPVVADAVTDSPND
jgi:hypothetical protein